MIWTKLDNPSLIEEHLTYISLKIRKIEIRPIRNPKYKVIAISAK